MSDLHVRLHKDILWLILDRPPQNPLSVEMLQQLTTAINNAVKHPPRLLVITGMGEQAFCTGVDLADNAEALPTLLKAAQEADTAFGILYKHTIPTVALVKGSVFGAGSELVALCNTVIARADAIFRLPAVNARVFPSAYSIYLPATIGQEATTRLVQSRETFNAREALRLGLVHQVLPVQRFRQDSEDLLTLLATVGINV